MHILSPNTNYVPNQSLPPTFHYPKNNRGLVTMHNKPCSSSILIEVLGNKMTNQTSPWYSTFIKQLTVLHLAKKFLVIMESEGLPLCSHTHTPEPDYTFTTRISKIYIHKTYFSDKYNHLPNGVTN
jgi:hypothetical protein